MGFIERVVWVFAILVIAGAVFLAWKAKPSPILRIFIPPRKKVEPSRLKADLERWLRSIQRRRKRSAAKEDKQKRAVSVRQEVLSRLHALCRKYPNELIRSYSYNDRTLIEKYSNWNEALRAVRNVEATILVDDQDRVVGIQIDSLPPNSPLRDYVGLQPGDVITSICGYMPQAKSEAEMLSEAKRLFERLKDQDVLYLEIKRGGRPMLITLQFQR